MDSHHPRDHGNAFELHMNYKPIHWLSVIGMMTMVVFLICLNFSLIISIREFHRKNKNAHKSKSLVSSVITTISFALTALICSLTTMLTIISNDFYHRSVVGDIFIKTSLYSYTISQTLMIFTFVTRIEGAFGGSALEYPPILIRFLYCSSITFAVFCFFMASALIFESWSIFVPALIIWMTLFLCLSVILCVLFTRKANLLLVAVSEGDNIDTTFLYITIKQSILVPMAIITSFTSFTIFIFQHLRTQSTEWIPAAIFWIVVDCTVSSIGVFLLFSFNNKLYDQFCCLLHRQCQKCKTSHLKLDNTTDQTKSSMDTTTITKSTADPLYISTTHQSAAKSAAKSDIHSMMANDGCIDDDNDDINTKKKPKLTMIPSIKRMISNSKNNQLFLAVNLMDSTDAPKFNVPKPKLNSVHSAPPRFQSSKKAQHCQSRSLEL